MQALSQSEILMLIDVPSKESRLLHTHMSDGIPKVLLFQRAFYTIAKNILYSIGCAGAGEGKGASLGATKLPTIGSTL